MKRDSIRNYSNTIQLDFAERGDNFSLNVPHKSKWDSIIKFLRQRGWKITENSHYKENYNCLSKYHKLGTKRNMSCLLEISSGFIRIEFGNTKNLWNPMAQSFWSDPTDERFTQLTYLESAAVKLEIYKLIKFCNRYEMEFHKEDKDLPPEEYIIHKLKVNSHIHGKVECLNDIAIDMLKDNYNSQQNNNDRDKKKIICGQTKYFYDWKTKRLSYGEVWHNINNMWWVICGGKLRNVCSSDLFDLTEPAPRREIPSKSKFNDILAKFEKKREYRRCEAIYKQMISIYPV